MPEPILHLDFEGDAPKARWTGGAFDKWLRPLLAISGTHVSSNWFSTSDFMGGDRWFFFAFTYDGARKDENAVVYIGDEKYIIEADNTNNAGAGRLKNKFIGSRNTTNPVIQRQRNDTPGLIPESL